MSSTKTDHYFRLLTLLFEGPTKILLEILLRKSGRTFPTLDTYLNSHQSKIHSNLPGYQYDRLFRPGTQIEKKIFDISLTHNLLTKLFHLSIQEDQWITNIKDIRDNLSHRCDSFEIDETDFRRMWQGLVDATNGLAGQISHSYLQEMTDIVEDVKQRLLPPPGPYVDILRDWLGTMHGTINELKDDMKTLKKTSETSTNILEKIVHVDTRKGEPARKRMKILDPNLERMQDSFKKTMDALPDDFTAPSAESDDMYKKLNESRRLYVAGRHSSQYLQTALYVIRLFGIDIKRCVEMMDCSDWKHVNSDDVSLVLFRDPFGINHISSERTRQIRNFLDSIVREIGRMPLNDRMLVIITSDYDAHLQYMDTCYHEPHDVLNDVVRFLKPTSEEDPHVINYEPSLTPVSDTCSELQTLQEQTKVYVDYNAKQALPTQRFADAKKILRQHKMLAISGPRNSGKTVLATNLMALYSSDRCVLLQRPTDMRCIRFGNVSMVLVEDFTGKIEPNKQTAIEWYGVFDVLLPAVVSGKLSVIIVSEAESLRRCQLPTHGLLKYGITLTSPVIPIIKPEPERDLATGDTYMMVNASTSLAGQRKSLRNASFEEKKTFNLEREYGSVESCTLMPSGHLIIAYYGYVVLMDIDFTFMSQEDFSNVSGIATVNDTSVIITRRDQYLQYIHVNLSISHTSLTLGNKIDVGENVKCKCIDVNDTDIYVACNNSGRLEIRVLHKGSGIIHNTIALDASGLSLRSGIKVSPNGDRVYTSSDMSVICISTRGELVYKYTSLYTTTRGIIVDNEDNLLVCSALFNTINLIDKDGKELKAVLNESDGIVSPRCLCYREFDSCLVVVCDKGILTFKVNW